MAPRFRLSELQHKLGGDTLSSNDPELTGAASLDKAGPDQVSFVVGRSHLKAAMASRAGALIVSPTLTECGLECPLLVIDNPHAAFAHTVALFNPPPSLNPNIHPSVHIGSDAHVSAEMEIGPGVVIGARCRIGRGSRIGPNCVIGDDVVIGDDALLHPNVTIYAGCHIGHRVILHSGVVIGADGFGLAWETDHWLKVPQIGIAILGDDVEIGANTTVDRGALDDTIIEDGVKVDNQVQIAHNCHIGAHSAIAGCVGIAGSTRIGQRCRLGGGASIMGHYTIADDVTISAGSFVAKDILQPGVYTSVQPVMPHEDWLKNAAQLRHLAEMRTRLKAMEKTLAQIQNKDN